MRLTTTRRAAASALATLALTATPALAAAVSTGHSGWSWGYPTPQGQTLSDVAFDGATGYAVGDFGTVLTSTDSGATWVGLPSGTTSDLQFVQEVSASDVVVAGGCTVSESTDSGAQFTQLPLDLGQSGCQNPVAGISFSSAQNGYIELQDGSVYYTNNGGATLQARTPASVGSSQASGIDFISPTQGFAIDGNGDIEETQDGANSWATVATTPNPLSGITFVNATTAFAVGDAGELLGSTDGGTSWSELPLKLAGGAAAPDLRQITCADARNCLISTDSGSDLIKTADGGQTGTVVNPSAQAINAVAYSTGATVVGVGGSGTTVLSGDGGSTFPTEAPTDLSGFQPTNGLTLGGASGDAFAGGQQGQIAATFDGGQSWSELRAPTGQPIDRVAFPNASVGYVLDAQGSLLKTTDGGTSWSSFPTGHSPASVLLAPTASRVLLVGPKGVRRSTDSGTSFSAVSGDVRLSHGRGAAVASLRLTDASERGTTIVAWGPSGLFTSADGGTTWRQLPKPPLGLAIQDVSLLNARTVWVLGANGALDATTNAGRTWSAAQAVGGLARPEAVSFSSRQDGMLALTNAFGALGQTAFADVTLLSTTNGGRTWQPQVLAGGQGGALLATPGVDYLMGRVLGDHPDTPNAFFTTSDQGSSGHSSSLKISLAHRKLTAAQLAQGAHKVTVTGQLGPVSEAGEQVVISYRSLSGSWHTALASVATGGDFSLTIHGITATTDFVAQSLGDGVNDGAGTPVLQLTVTP